jgi:SAM-dependent methyltransferase
MNGLQAKTQSPAPTTSADFDRAYRALFTLWGDIRVPSELIELIGTQSPLRVLELGCGVGRFSRHVARAGHRVVAVDFSPVAIDKARARVARDERKPEFRVGDVTNLHDVDEGFDVSFDVGCFHCLDAGQQSLYAAGVFRLLEPGGTLLIWALDASPSGIPLSPVAIEKVFDRGFRLRRAKPSRRRLARSHWYWLVREPLAASVRV